jgi:hypothetical protein
MSENAARMQLELDETSLAKKDGQHQRLLTPQTQDSPVRPIHGTSSLHLAENWINDLIILM